MSVSDGDRDRLRSGSPSGTVRSRSKESARDNESERSRSLSPTRSDDARSRSSHHRRPSIDSRDRDRNKDRESDRNLHERRRDRVGDRDEKRDDKTRERRRQGKSRDGSDRSRYRSRSRSPRTQEESRRSRRDDDERYYLDDHDDYYRRSDTRRRSRSRDRTRDRRDRDRRDRDYDRRDRHKERDRDDKVSRRSRSRSPRLSEDERDQRTIFVQQLAARLRTKELIAFFEQAGPVRDAQIVKDRISGRSKGVGYVEFRDIDTVQKALKMTGQKLLDIPVIVQITEAEKNRLARAESSAAAQQALEQQRQQQQNHGPYHRLYVGNVHFAISEADLKQIFESYGEVEFVALQKDETGVRSKGYGFVQFSEKESATNALELNGFKLGGRPIRVGLGNDKINSEPTESILQRLNGGAAAGSVSPGGTATGFAMNSRIQPNSRSRDDKKPTGALASALDDSDATGVSFNTVSRESLMRKLMREEDALPVQESPQQVKPNISTTQASRCIVLNNMFDPAEEDGDDWIKELEDDVKAECEEKYGNVVHIAVEPNSQGEIYVKFENVSGGEKAIQGLNGRFFGGRQINASPVVDMVYSLRFPRSKAL
ncbi:hypothetical protein V1511DRAFT_492363 [Dipodascopsis uninucleata]